MSPGSPIRTVAVLTQGEATAGGLVRSASDMADGMRAAGRAVDVVGAGAPGRALRLARRRPLRRLRRLTVELQRRGSRAALRGDWDLVYAPSDLLPPPGGGVRVLHQGARHPRVALEAQRAARRAAGGGAIYLSAGEVRRQERELAGADLVRVESASVRDELTARGVDPRRIVLAPPGVDLERFRPGARPHRLRVAVVGPLSLWKGLDITAALVRRLGHDAQFVAVGGPVCTWSRRLAASLPLTPHDDVATMLAGAHALVLPSACDGFGYVVLEAMAAGAVPFVSPEVGSADLVAELDPRLVQPREVFAERVADLVRELPLAGLGAAARAIAERHERAAMAAAAARAVLDAAERL